jgi:hypothetical protein
MCAQVVQELSVYSTTLDRCRREDNIKMDLQEVGGARGDWMELAQDRDGCGRL